MVTTRSRLRSAGLAPFMLAATRRIMGQLGEQPGTQRYVSVVASPREFWTVSTWGSRHLMQEFLRSGAHGQYMWEVGRWLESFWLMRWRPTRHEIGSWDGQALAPEMRAPPADTGVSPEVRDEILAAIPSLRAAFGPEGAPTYDAAPEVRHQRELVAGAAGLLVRLSPGSAHRGSARRSLARLRRDLAMHDAELLRVATGHGQAGGGCYLMGVWRSQAGSGRLLDSDWMAEAASRWGEGLWACELLPDNEFGQWDGLRLRDLGEQGDLGVPRGPDMAPHVTRPSGADAGHPDAGAQE